MLSIGFIGTFDTFSKKNYLTYVMLVTRTTFSRLLNQIRRTFSSSVTGIFTGKAWARTLVLLGAHTLEAGRCFFC